MLAGLRHVLTSPVVGPVAIGMALMLAVAFGLSASNWEAQRVQYEARLTQLSQTSDRAQDMLRTQLAACHAVGDARRVTDVSDPAPTTGARGARRLLEQQPEGIDACARMESADQAVLSNLKK